MSTEFWRTVAWPAFLLTHVAAVFAAATLAPRWASPLIAATTALLMLALIAAELRLPFREEWSPRGDRDIARDVGHTLLYGAIGVNLTRLLFLVLLAQGLRALPWAATLHAWPHASPIWLQVLLVVIIGDALEYFFHRLSHTQPLLWRVHALHHSPTRLSVVKGGRHHYLYALGRGVFVWLPLLVLGAPPELVYWQFVAVTVTGLLAHANVAFRIPAFVHRLLVTPEFHRLHHSTDPVLGHANFGVVLPLWDIALGTHADPLTVPPTAVGITNDPIPRAFADELGSPFRWNRLVDAHAGRDRRRI